ncbi:MAG: hypothetical protein V4623_00820 [Pseudomonadota bacterium]
MSSDQGQSAMGAAIIEPFSGERSDHCALAARQDFDHLNPSTMPAANAAQ